VSAVSRAAAPRGRNRLNLHAIFLAVLIGAPLGCSGCRQPGVSTPPGPSPHNVVLIVSDALRPDHLGCYGYPRATSPNVDRLASEGIRCIQVISQSSATRAAHAAMLTSRLPTDFGILGNTGVLPEATESLAKVLRENGYATGAFVSNPVLTKKQMPGIEQGFQVYDARLTTREPNRPVARRDCRETNAAALRWLAKAREPFFLWVHYIEPHGPYTTRAAGKLREFQNDALAAKQHKRLPALTSDFGPEGIPRYQVLPGIDDVAAYIAHYDARIWEMDAAVGELLAALKRKGVSERTVVAFTADHGEALGEHGYYFQHENDLTEERLRIPLVVRVPGRHRGVKVRAEVQTIDVMPTLLAAAGLGNRIPAAVRGIPLLSAVRTPAPAPRPVISAVLTDQSARVRYSLHYLGWKLIVARPEEPPRLFYLPRDAGELHNLAGSDPREVQDLTARLAPHFVKQLPAEATSVDGESREALRSLGYLR